MLFIPVDAVWLKDFLGHHLLSLNKICSCSWVREQHSQCREEAWLDGVTEYQRACQELVDTCRQTPLAESSANALEKGPDFGASGGLLLFPSTSKAHTCDGLTAQPLDLGDHLPPKPVVAY